MYKYDEYTKEEFEHCNHMFGRGFTYISELPHGTTFHVENGEWKGKVIHRDGETYVQATISDDLWENGENQFKIDHTYSLWITIIEPETST